MSDTPQPASGRRILVIAEMFFASKLKGEVQKAGYEYVPAAAEKSALEKAGSLRPDAIVLDLAKTRFDVPGFLSRLRAEPELSAIPVIGFSGHLDTQRMQEGQEKGCTLVVSNGQITGNFPSVLQKALPKG
ncbi:MAG: hypothetical protein HYU36_08075 [Planctomycetes bacterium]|nr:hypothetical protein [Planctomycetota bacterium]